MNESDRALPFLVLCFPTISFQKKATYPVETIIFVQTMKTSIWITRYWSKWAFRRGGRGDLQISPPTSPERPSDQHRVV
jgi:hypothetical protein